MGIAHFLNIRYKFIDHFIICQPLALSVMLIAAQVNFIDIHWLIKAVCTRFKPFIICPLILIKAYNLAAPVRSQFVIKSVWVVLCYKFPVLLLNYIFVTGIIRKTGNKCLPYFFVDLI